MSTRVLRLTSAGAPDATFANGGFADLATETASRFVSFHRSKEAAAANGQIAHEPRRLQAQAVDR